MIEMLDGEPPNFSDSQIVAMDKIKVNPSPSPAKAEVRRRHCLGHKRLILFEVGTRDNVLINTRTYAQRARMNLLLYNIILLYIIYYIVINIYIMFNKYILMIVPTVLAASLL